MNEVPLGDFDPYREPYLRPYFTELPDYEDRENTFDPLKKNGPIGICEELERLDLLPKPSKRTKVME